MVWTSLPWQHIFSIFSIKDILNIFQFTFLHLHIMYRLTEIFKLLYTCTLLLVLKKISAIVHDHSFIGLGQNLIKIYSKVKQQCNFRLIVGSLQAQIAKNKNIVRDKNT